MNTHSTRQPEPEPATILQLPVHDEYCTSPEKTNVPYNCKGTYEISTNEYHQMNIRIYGAKGEGGHRRY